MLMGLIMYVLYYCVCKHTCTAVHIIRVSNVVRHLIRDTDGADDVCAGLMMYALYYCVCKHTCTAVHIICISNVVNDLIGDADGADYV
jgi:high-affinity nickel permease